MYFITKQAKRQSQFIYLHEISVHGRNNQGRWTGNGRTEIHLKSISSPANFWNIFIIILRGKPISSILIKEYFYLLNGNNTGKKGTMKLRIKIITLWIGRISLRNHKRTYPSYSVPENKRNLRHWVGDYKKKLKLSVSLDESEDKCFAANNQQFQTEKCTLSNAWSTSTAKRSEPLKNCLTKFTAGEF